jgi:hypothetical protein
MKTGDIKPEAFADEDVNGSGSLPGLEPSAERPGPALSAPPIKGVLRKKGGGDDSDSEGDDEMTESKGPSGGSSDDRPPQIAAREAQFVVASKFLVAFVLILSAGLLGYFSYAITRAQEEAEFETKVS